jgi:hypothetical protein
MSANSNIGFHAAYITVDGQFRETGMGNAEIGSYLTHIGLRVEAIRFITHAPPEGMARLTVSRARALVHCRRALSGSGTPREDGRYSSPHSSGSCTRLRSGGGGRSTQRRGLVPFKAAASDLLHVTSSGGVFSLRSISLTARTKHVALIMTWAIHRGYALPAARPRR